MCSCALGKSGKFSVHVSFVKGNACSVLKEKFRKPLNNISKLLMGLIFPHILCGKSSYEALKAPSNPLFLKDVFPETQPFKTYPSLCCWKIHQFTGIFFLNHSVSRCWSQFLGLGDAESLFDLLLVLSTVKSQPADNPPAREKGVLGLLSKV